MATIPILRENAANSIIQTINKSKLKVYSKNEKENAEEYLRHLNFEKINNRIVGKISSTEALADATPIKWSGDVMNEKNC